MGVAAAVDRGEPMQHAVGAAEDVRLRGEVPNVSFLDRRQHSPRGLLHHWVCCRREVRVVGNICIDAWAGGQEALGGGWLVG